MKYRSLFITPFILALAACGGGSESSSHTEVIKNEYPVVTIKAPEKIPQVARLTMTAELESYISPIEISLKDKNNTILTTQAYSGSMTSIDGLEKLQAPVIVQAKPLNNAEGRTYYSVLLEPPLLGEQKNININAMTDGVLRQSIQSDLEDIFLNPTKISQLDTGKLDQNRKKLQTSLINYYNILNINTETDNIFYSIHKEKNRYSDSETGFIQLLNMVKIIPNKEDGQTTLKLTDQYSQKFIKIGANIPVEKLDPPSTDAIALDFARTLDFFARFNSYFTSNETLKSSMFSAFFSDDYLFNGYKKYDILPIYWHNLDFPSAKLINYNITGCIKSICKVNYEFIDNKGINKKAEDFIKYDSSESYFNWRWIGNQIPKK
ncbi:MAG: hypothetical protein NT086_15710 [Proteobacteria bacterium]|nr:hypothetical protein [Pseudomonadota bacterium]